MISQPSSPISIADDRPVSLSPFTERGQLRQAADRTTAIVAAEKRVGVALAELVLLGVDVTRLDIAALAEQGQGPRRARAL